MKQEFDKLINENEQLRRELDELKKTLTSDYYKNLADKLEAELKETKKLHDEIILNYQDRIVTLETELRLEKNSWKVKDEQEEK